MNADLGRIELPRTQMKNLHVGLLEVDKLLAKQQKGAIQLQDSIMAELVSHRRVGLLMALEQVRLELARHDWITEDHERPMGERESDQKKKPSPTKKVDKRQLNLVQDEETEPPTQTDKGSESLTLPDIIPTAYFLAVRHVVERTEDEEMLTRMLETLGADDGLTTAQREHLVLLIHRKLGRDVEGPAAPDPTPDPELPGDGGEEFDEGSLDDATRAQVEQSMDELERGEAVDFETMFGEPLDPDAPAETAEVDAEPAIGTYVRWEDRGMERTGYVWEYFIAADEKRYATITGGAEGEVDISWTTGVPPHRLEVLAPPPEPLTSAVTKKEVDAAFTSWFRTESSHRHDFAADGKPKRGSSVREMEPNYRHWWRDAVRWADLGLPRPSKSGSGRVEAWDWRIARHQEQLEGRRGETSPAEAKPEAPAEPATEPAERPYWLGSGEGWEYRGTNDRGESIYRRRVLHEGQDMWEIAYGSLAERGHGRELRDYDGDPDRPQFKKSARDLYVDQDPAKGFVGAAASEGATRDASREGDRPAEEVPEVDVPEIPRRYLVGDEALILAGFCRGRSIPFVDGRLETLAAVASWQDYKAWCSRWGVRALKKDYAALGKIFQRFSNRLAQTEPDEGVQETQSSDTEPQRNPPHDGYQPGQEESEDAAKPEMPAPIAAALAGSTEPELTARFGDLTHHGMQPYYLGTVGGKPDQRCVIDRAKQTVLDSGNWLNMWGLALRLNGLIPKPPESAAPAPDAVPEPVEPEADEGSLTAAELWGDREQEAKERGTTILHMLAGEIAVRVQTGYATRVTPIAQASALIVDALSAKPGARRRWEDRRWEGRSDSQLEQDILSELDDEAEGVLGCGSWRVPPGMTTWPTLTLFPLSEKKYNHVRGVILIAWVRYLFRIPTPAVVGPELQPQRKEVGHA